MSRQPSRDEVSAITDPGRPAGQNGQGQLVSMTGTPDLPGRPSRMAIGAGVVLVAMLGLVGSMSLFFNFSSADSRAEEFKPPLHRTMVKAPPPHPGPTYATLAQKSISMLEHTFYNGTGLWHMCIPVTLCNTKNMDWGADNLTYDLYLRWQVAKDPTVVPLLARLARTALWWPPAKVGSSDNIMWDAIAEVREYQVTGRKIALAKAEMALARLDSGPDGGFNIGACPAISYQWPHGRLSFGLKTLETDSNYVKAALLLYQVTRDSSYLDDAEVKYDAIQHYYLDESSWLYTDFVYDNGTTCQAVPRVFLGSVNGNMIWDGITLAADTGRAGYLQQAIATAHAVVDHLSDGTGVYNPLFTDIDVGEPLIEAMYDLATIYHQGFAGNWLLTTASAAGGDVNSSYEFGRLFDGPPPTGAVTSWSVNGGVALMTAAAALDSSGRTADPGFWKHATWVPENLYLTGTSLPIHFTGQAIALVGTIGDVCCRPGHAWVALDGVPAFSDVGIWQDRSSPARRLNNQVLFAWRWRRSGPHTITILPAANNPLEGGAYFHMIGYLMVP
jgi:hypothetical protein